jgi:uncharacterized repeat protein (TIGR03943 family)
MKQRICFFLPVLTLATWGVVLLHALVSGKIGSLLHPIFRPLVGIAGGLLLGMALVYVLCFRPARSGRKWGPALGGFAWATVPLLAAIPLTPDGFSVRAVEMRGIQTQLTRDRSGGAADMRNRLAVDDPQSALPVEVMDLLLAAEDPEVAAKLEGRRVRLTGQYYPLSADQFRILRFLMTCCAADAQPLGVVASGTMQDVKEMDWVEVAGSVRFLIKDGRSQVELADIHAEKVPEPTDPFVY